MSILNGVKVLDLSKVIAGPTTGMLLGDLGADVIKIEEPKVGDEARYFPPFQKNVSAFFMACNRNKRGLSINLKSDEGLKIFYKLVEDSDVIIESFRTGITEKLKIDYGTLKKINSKIIYCSISGFGRKGPKSNSGGYDALAQAYGGLMSVTGLGEGYPPVRAGYSVSDVTTGLNATIGVLSAYIKRMQTGKGDLVETSLLQTQVGLMSYYATMYDMTKKIPTSIGSRHPNFAPYQAFKTSDGYVLLGISNNRLWERMCSLSIFHQLKDNENYKTNDLRVSNLDALSNEIEFITEKISKKSLINMLESVNVPCSPINNIKEVVEDEQVNYNKMIIDMDHPIVGNFKSASTPFSLKDTMFSFEKHPPEKGEHNLEILNDLGLNEEDIIALKEKNII